MLPEDDYRPTRQEEIAHGTRVVTRHFGDPGPDEIETEAVCGAVCTHEVSLYKGDLTHPRYPMIPGHEAVHRVTRVREKRPATSRRATMPPAAGIWASGAGR